MPTCDGCGRSVDGAHIKQRIARLELATRFRPVHIGVLLIDAAPPSRAEDFFYAVNGDRVRSETGDRYFSELAKLAGVKAVSPSAEPESALAEFQRRGFFLASAVECPMGDSDDLKDAVRRLAPTILRRVQASYKPKHVALISESTSELIGAFRAAGWGDRLILDKNAPFPRESIGNRLATVLAQAG